MKKKLIMLFHIIVITAMIGLLVYVIYTAEELRISSLAKYVISVVGYILWVTGVKKKSARGRKFYEVQYKNIVEGAFVEDKGSYKKLLDAAACFDRDENGKAQRILDKLLKKCTRTRDYTAVYMFKGLCYSDEGLIEKSIEAYQRLLQYDMSSSRAWSNMGAQYVELGMAKEAEDAYIHAILYDSNNYTAYSNLSNLYVQMGEPEKALENALKALELNSKMYQAISAAALAYKMLGDNENAEKYCKMYVMNGGSVKELKFLLDSV